MAQLIHRPPSLHQLINPQHLRLVPKTIINPFIATQQRPNPFYKTLSSQKHHHYTTTIDNRNTQQSKPIEPQSSTHFTDSPPFQSEVPLFQHDPTRPHEDWCLFHPVYQPAELKQIQVVRHQPKDLSDRVVSTLVKTVRYSFDLLTRYKPPIKDHQQRSQMDLKQLRESKLVMTPDQWLSRILFLESIAGVPGMVAAMLRHFKSLRMSGRDGGWIRTLLEEAENERMHLLTFMKIKQPSVIFRSLVLAAQGVFANMFFVAYLISPKAAHRFVGMLEEEAVVTYSLAISELEEGLLPEWQDMKAPQIAVNYWRMKPDAKMIDLLYAVRADEANHRFVNHSLANIDATAFNPFAIKQPDNLARGTLPGFQRHESEQWARKVQEEFQSARRSVEEHKQMTSNDHHSGTQSPPAS